MVRKRFATTPKPIDDKPEWVRLTFDNWLGLIALLGAVATGVWYGAAQITVLTTQVGSLVDEQERHSAHLKEHDEKIESQGIEIVKIKSHVFGATP